MRTAKETAIETQAASATPRFAGQTFTGQSLAGQTSDSAETAARVAGVGLHPGPLHGKPAKLLGLDVGLARIGIAVCDPLLLAARPLFILDRRSRREDFAALAATVEEHEIQAIVCGLPLNMDGSEGPQATTTRKWALRLAQALRVIRGSTLPIVFWDERLSTFAAQELMRAHGLQGADDAAAAAVILQSYLDSLRTAPPKSTLYDSIVLPSTPTGTGPTRTESTKTAIDRETDTRI